MHTLNLFVPDTLGALYLSHSPGGQSRRGLVEWMLKRLRQRFERFDQYLVQMYILEGLGYRGLINS